MMTSRVPDFYELSVVFNDGDEWVVLDRQETIDALVEEWPGIFVRKDDSFHDWKVELVQTVVKLVQTAVRWK